MDAHRYDPLRSVSQAAKRVFVLRRERPTAVTSVQTWQMQVNTWPRPQTMNNSVGWQGLDLDA
jgi:hypothetical protein